MGMGINQTDRRPLFAFTAAAGIFPGAGDISEFWQRIVRAEVADLSRLDTRWGLDRDVYQASEAGQPNTIYLDQAFCLPDDKEKRGAQIRYGKEVLKRLSDTVKKHSPAFSFSDTALVLGTSWSDQGYYMNDVDFWFNGKDGFDKRFSPDEQVRDLAESLGARGPALAVDTACASSLYAVETAVNIIRSGQARSAVILGLNVVIPPFLMSAFSQLMALSPQGKSLPFSRHASGMVPGEAAAAVFLEPLEDALASHREILGVLCSTGLSSDGSEGSVFAPGAMGQKHAYERAYVSMDPSGVDYIEAHGTATALGDKTELEGIHGFFSPHMAKDKKIYVGSVKSLVGHSLAAAGISALIKSLLMLQHKTIPPHIAAEPSPVLEQTCIALARKPLALDTTDRPARIGVSSFGFGGSNVHLVLESYDERFHGGKGPSATNEALLPDLALVDFEAGFGTMLTSSELRPDFYSDGAPDDFPDDRFNGAVHPPVRGQFFPDPITIEAKGLKYGPKVLARIDAIQNHGVHLANMLIKRNPAVNHADDAAMVMTMNIGGARSFQVVRKYHVDYVANYLPGEKEILAETTLEDIGSGLGSMFSGYPAYHFDMKGFHQTCSGDTPAFWTTFLTAPLMIKNHCRSLILGAGHAIKTPVDLFDKRLAGASPPRVIEGTAMFLMKSMAAAREDGDRIRASIDAIVPFAKGDCFETACGVAGVDPETVDIREYSQLDPESDYKQETCQRFLGEATGCEVLSSVLLKKGRRAAIEVYQGQQLRFIVFITKHSHMLQERPTMALPLALALRDGAPYMFKRINASESILAPEVKKEDPSKAVDVMNIFCLWHETTSTTIQQYLKTQAWAASMKRTVHDGPENRSSQSALPSGLTVLSKINRTSQNTFNAQLIVDESHPYFFDHPLDHIPGILMMQGVLELFDHAATACFGGDLFISSLDIQFKKICEKSMPVVIELTLPETATDEPLDCVCDVFQNNKLSAHLAIQARRVTPQHMMSERDVKKQVIPYGNPAMLHKRKAENVLVSDYILTEGECLFDLVTPPPGHVLRCDSRNIYSMLYILEVTRQCGMIILHSVSNIPLDTPMILLSLTINLDRPALGDSGLRIGHTLANDTHSARTVMGSMDFSLYDAGGKLGSSTLSTLMVI